MARKYEYKVQAEKLAKFAALRLLKELGIPEEPSIHG